MSAVEVGVLNAGWRLRMVHHLSLLALCDDLQVLNAGWRLRMVHQVGESIYGFAWRVLNAGWRLRMVHVAFAALLNCASSSAQRRMASENGSPNTGANRAAAGEGAQRRMASENGSPRPLQVAAITRVP